MNLYLLKFNNYYNRQVKKFDSLYDYSDYIVATIEQKTNFNPGDGINTKQVFNYDGKIQPDYVIVAEGEEIISRWFILDSTFIRKGQFEAQLKRDVVVDNYNDIIDAPCFIEKATLQNDDPMIFNNEDMSFNEIKTSENVLQDETKTPWIVGYIPSDSFKEATEVKSSFVEATAADIEIDDITQWKYYNYSGLKPGGFEYYMGDADIRYVYIFGHKRIVPKTWFSKEKVDYALAQVAINRIGQMTKCGNHMENRQVDWDFVEGRREIQLIEKDSLPYSDNFILTWDKAIEMNWLAEHWRVYCAKEGSGIPPQKFNGYLQKVQEQTNVKTWYCNEAVKDTRGIYTDDPYSEEIFALNGKTIKDKASNTTYKIHVVKEYKQDVFKTTKTDPVFIEMDKIFPKDLSAYGDEQSVQVLSGNGKSFNGDICAYEVYGTAYTISLIQQEVNIKTTVLAQNARTHLTDAPYDMFCIPYNQGIKITDGEKVITNSSFAALNMAIEIGKATGSANIYDVQLLPYCPLRNVIGPNGINVSGVKKNPIVSSDGSKTYSYILWCDVSNFSFDIPYKIDVKDVKISNECDKYRLCSPNYGAAFDFSAAKNGGVSKFNVDATYKPFNPYIHVNPDFKNMYGQDFNDSRGLIVGGDFSLTQLNSAWADYELTNKNYQNTFDRQIQNMNKLNNYQRISEIANIATGTLMGAGAGAVMGGPTVRGGAIGAGIGAAASLGAGLADLYVNDQIRKETIDYTKDQFGYQLQNIQAIPYALAKTSALTANNKLYPILEYYTCSDTEKEALRNKIKYNGMTVMRIGTIREFLKKEESYIKGKIIRLNECDDFHMANDIAAEIDKGVFI